MIGTPNGGDSVADETIIANTFNPLLYFNNSVLCTPALLDLKTDANYVHVTEKSQY